LRKDGGSTDSTDTMLTGRYGDQRARDQLGAARIYEVPISYSGRTYAEGKKINWKDGVADFWHIARFNLSGPRAPVHRRQAHTGVSASAPGQIIAPPADSGAAAPARTD
jgi:hypothetical protein